MLSNYVIWMNIRRWHCDTNKWKIVERSSVKIEERLGRQWRRHFYEPDNDDGDKCMNFYSPCSFICIKLYSRKIFIISFQIRSEIFYFAMENLEENLNSLWQKSKENLQMKIVQLLLCRTYELAIYPQWNYFQFTASSLQLRLQLYESNSLNWYSGKQ